MLTKKAYLRFSNNYLIVESEEEKKELYLPDINTIIIDTLEISLSCYLLNEIQKNKVNLVICDEKHNPSSQIQSIYGCFDCSGKTTDQMKWKDSKKGKIWTKIIVQKITSQCSLLERLNIDTIDNVSEYLSRLKVGDPLNIEGTIAKMYFCRLFGINFNRRVENDINAMLNYGYSIILSFFNREIIACGYSTKIGLHHSNRTNSFNLSSDLMEPFRVFVDEIVFNNLSYKICLESKFKLLNVLYVECKYKKKKMTLINAIPLYISDVFESLKSNKNIIGVIEFA